MKITFSYLVISADGRKIVSDTFEEALSLAEVFRGSRVESRIYGGIFNLTGDSTDVFPPVRIMNLDPEDSGFDEITGLTK